MAEGLKWHSIPAIDRGLNSMLHPSQIRDNEASYADGVIFEPGEFKSRPGFRYIGEDGSNWPLSGTPRFLDSLHFADPSTQDKTICITTFANSGRVYELNTTSNVWSNITLAAGFNPGDAVGGPYTGAYYQTESESEAWYLTNGGDVLRYDGSGGVASVTILTGASNYDHSTDNHQARCVAMFANRLWLGVTIENAVTKHRRLRYSTVDAPGTWESTTYIDLNDDARSIRALYAYGDALVAFKRDTIYEIRPTDNGSAPFRKSRTVSGLGVLGNRSVVETPIGLIFLDSECQDFYAYDGSPTPRSMGARVLLRGVTPLINQGADTQVIGAVDPQVRRVYFAVPIYGRKFASSSTYRPHLVLIYDLKLDKWERYEIPAYGLGFHPKAANTPWTDLEGTWAEQTWRWVDGQALAGFPQLLLSTADGYTRIASPYHSRDEGTVGTDNHADAGVMLKKEYIRPVDVPKGASFGIQELRITGTILGARVVLETDNGYASVEPSFRNGTYRWTNIDLHGEYAHFTIQRRAGQIEPFIVRNIELGYLYESETD